MIKIIIKIVISLTKYHCIINHGYFNNYYYHLFNLKVSENDQIIVESMQRTIECMDNADHKFNSPPPSSTL